MPDERWRTGTKPYQGSTHHRTIYIQRGNVPSLDDPMIGAADSPELAALVVEAVNTGHRVPGSRWWSAGRLVYDRPGAPLTSGFIVAMDTPELAGRVVAAVRGTLNVATQD